MHVASLGHRQSTESSRKKDESEGELLLWLANDTGKHRASNGTKLGGQDIYIYVYIYIYVCIYILESAAVCVLLVFHKIL